MVVPLPHCSSDDSVTVFTVLVEKKSLFHLRMRGSTEAPKSLNAVVQAAKSEAKLFGLKSDRLELVPAEVDEDELPLYLSGLNTHLLTLLVDQFATLCPHVTIILANYEPRTAMIDGSRYLDLTTRSLPIKARLDQRNVSFDMIPVTITEPLVDRPARTAFYYQQRAAVIDEIRRLVSDSTATASTARIRKHVFVEIWTGSVDASINAVRAMISDTKATLDHDHALLVEEAELWADRVDEKASKITRIEARLERHEKRKHIYYLGQILMTTLAAILAKYVNIAAAAAITGTLAVLILMAVHDRQDAVEKLKTARKKPKALMSQLRKEKQAADSKVKSIDAQRAAIDEWSARLDALRNAVQSDYLTVAALLAMRGPLVRLTQNVISGDSKPQADDLVDLALSFLDNPNDKHALGKVLRALTPKVESVPE
ncbi:hypothetical protein GGF32_005687 [Allomyces javanicus]|nr:hypothetical protein GGF32_005687 [Allomyces javanicus]